jgi:hypothetical protein
MDLDFETENDTAEQSKKVLFSSFFLLVEMCYHVSITYSHNNKLQSTHKIFHLYATKPDYVC